MKKITAFFLTLILLFNISCIQISAYTTISKKEESILVSLGFTDEIEKNTYLTRDKYAKIILSCYGYDSNNINLAATMEFLGLYDNGEYNWAGYATFGETVRGLISLLGYDLEMKYFGKNALDFIAKGNELGITANLNKGFDEKITEEEFAKMLIACLDAPVMMGKYENGSFNIGVYEDETFLSKRHNIYYSKGYVTANEHSTLSSSNGLPSGKVQIDDVEYYEGSTDCSSLLGYYVEYYYRVDDDEYTLLWVYADSLKNNELYLETEDIIEFKDRVCTYYDDGRKKTAKMDSGVSYIYNGKSAALEDIPNLKPEIGEVTFTDFNNDGYFDSAIIMNYKQALADDININKSILYTRGSSASKYELEDRENLYIYNEKYEQLTLNNIAQNNVLWIAESLDNDILTILVSKMTVDGKVTGTGTDSDGRKYIMLNDEIYYFSAADVKIPLIGEEGTFYLDISGKIADFKSQKSGYSIGWLISAYPSDEDEEILMIKMFNGEVSIYECTEKLSYNGIKNFGHDNIISDLKAGNDKIEGQIIRYKLSSDNKITFLQTATSSYTEDDRLFAEASIPKQGQGVGVLYKKNLGNLFTNSFALEDNATVFIIPSNKENYEKYVMGGPELIANDSTVFGITGYKLNLDDDRCVAAVYDKTVSAGDSAVANKPSILKNINKVLLSNDEEGFSVKYFEISTAPSSITEKEAFTDDEEFIEGLSEGDMIRIDVDSDNNITGLSRIFSADEKVFINNISGTQWGAQFRGNAGTVTVKQQNSVKIRVSSSYASYMTTELLLLDYCAVYISEINSNGKRELRIGSKSDIAVGDTLVYTTRVGQDFRVVVYK